MGVECTRTRHRYSGTDYEFNIEIVDLRRTKAGRTAWRAPIVSEVWQTTSTKGEIGNTTWLKVLSGSDVASRDQMAIDSTVETDQREAG